MNPMLVLFMRDRSVKREESWHQQVDLWVARRRELVRRRHSHFHPVRLEVGFDHVYQVLDLVFRGESCFTRDIIPIPVLFAHHAGWRSLLAQQIRKLRQSAGVTRRRRQWHLRLPPEVGQGRPGLGPSRSKNV